MRSGLSVSKLAVAAGLLAASARSQAGTETIFFAQGKPGDFFGAVVGGAGDVDADGLDDLFVASTSAVVVYSVDDGAVLLDVPVVPSTAGMYGSVSVAEAGDVDQDGHDDLIIGNPFDDTGCDNCGRVDVISGRDGASLHTFVSTASKRLFGWSVAGGHDVNVDGIPDILVGAPDMGPYTLNPTGFVEIYSGADGSLLQHVTCGSDCMSITWQSAVDSFGRSVAFVGDVDGDGRADWMASYDNHNYSAYEGGIFFYTQGIRGAKVFRGADASVAYHVMETALFAPGVISAAGDLDADGWPDFLVGDADDQVRAYSGKTGGLLHEVTRPGPDFGYSLSRAGDVDCDGFDDYLLGWPQWLSSAHEASARVYSGKDGSELAVALPVEGLLYGSFGLAVGFVGDANDDGKPDLAVGDPYHGTAATAFTGGVTLLSVGTGHALPFGVGCPGSGGVVPALAVEGCQILGGAATFEVTGGLGGAPALLCASLTAAPPTAHGCSVLIDIGDPPVCHPLVLRGVGPGRGSAHVTTVVPASFLPGVPVFLQAFVADPGAAGSLAMTNAVEWTLDQVYPVDPPKVIYVDDDACPGPGLGTETEPYCDIQTALDAAQHGDEVIVLDGHYTGPLNSNLGFLGKRITVRSSGGPLNCILDAQGAPGSCVFRFDYGETPDSVLEGFTITGGNSGQFDEGGGIQCVNSSPTISRCIIRDNAAWSHGGGISILGGGPLIVNCTIADNTSGNLAMWGRGGGVSCEYSSATILRGCTVAANTARSNGFPAYGGGLYLRDAAGSSVVNGISWGNKATIGKDLHLETLPGPSITYTDIGGGTPGAGNLNINPLFVVPGPQGDYHLQPVSPCVDAGDPAFVPAAGEVDIDGEPRVSHGVVDVGSDEVP